MKRTLLTILQIVVTVLLLCWIFRDPTKRDQMATALHTANFLWLIPGALAVGIAFSLQTQRWRILLAAQDIHMGWWRAMRIFLIGAFFNLFLPGGTGGDVVKIFYAMKETKDRKSAAFLSVLVDRMMGLLGLVAVAATLCTLEFNLLFSKPITQALMGSLGIILGGSLTFIVGGFLVDYFRLAHKLPTWLPLHAKILEFATAFSTYARSPKTLLATFGISIPSHLLMFLAFYFAARAFGLFGGFDGLIDVFAVLPAIMTIASLPVSLSGLGVREGLFQQVFSELFNTPVGTAAMISMTGFLMIVFWGLVGGVIYMLFRPVGGIHIRELEQEVEKVEKTIEDAA
ncbi:hypothetical protein TSACC_22172 [Terrimicrobium sacchariphilum]|uniref:Lysylphosphatidylglycerol synthase TM region n=1 Tax=Terrimicrobium sacchariphilum TaxID=690879 RepID=A0A146GA90_TERSA|nr:lysylphosphatidylglycerol synthase transmembrane domain-containing protein [Terrimicrobium sacchariphilum]GAT33754.1 hypothetical protein TSACC_22172 [Terrimicrobium sacchariphilum]